MVEITRNQIYQPFLIMTIVLLVPFLDGSKSGKWNKYLNNVGDRGYTIKLAIDPLFMSRAYNFTLVIE